MRRLTRIESEKRTVEFMVRLYCRRKEGNRELCHECSEILDYALHRLSVCPHGEAKDSCRKCRTHCYVPAKRERIRQIMRWAGPRMLIYAPLEWLRHCMK